VPPHEELVISPELFQDPELLTTVSNDMYRIINKLCANKSRIRPLLESVIDRRPQAKDVKSTRVMDTEQLEAIEMTEQNTTNGEVYVNPHVPKRRTYIKETQQLRPILPKPSTTDSGSLSVRLQELSTYFKQSKLKTVGPSHLYTLLNRQLEYTSFYSTIPELTVIDKEKIEWEDCENILITVTLYVNENANKKAQEIELLGFHNLCHLRDTITCFSDIPEEDVSDKEGVTILDEESKKTVPSMFYIDNVFYIDTRHEPFTESIYRPKINAWLGKKKVNREVFKYRVVEMTSVLFKDMAIHLDRPFAFLHGDGCEHMFIFKDLRLISPNEYKNEDEFPRTIGTIRFVRYKCSMCTIYPSAYVTTGDVLSGCSPCYFCKKCYESFHAESSYDKTYNYKTAKYNGSIL
ncbi:small nuclear RNA activating complex, polypeptide 3, partial [Rhizopus stolonifer]